MKKPTTLRLSDDTINLVESLSHKLGINRTAVMEQAVRRLAELEQISLPAKEKPDAAK